MEACLPPVPRKKSEKVTTVLGVTQSPVASKPENVPSFNHSLIQDSLPFSSIGYTFNKGPCHPLSAVNQHTLRKQRTKQSTSTIPVYWKYPKVHHDLFVCCDVNRSFRTSLIRNIRFNAVTVSSTPAPHPALTPEKVPRHDEKSGNWKLHVQHGSSYFTWNTRNKNVSPPLAYWLCV